MIGHKEALASIPDPLPGALLLLGPPGVGKSLAARELAAKAGARKTDLQVLKTFTMRDARAMIEHHATRPLQSPVKVTVADITNASTGAINAALKTLEEPPPKSRIILHSDRTPLLTVMSRCHQVRFGVLHEDEIAFLLQQHEGMDEADAYELSEKSEGSMEVALRKAGMGESYAAVASLFAAMDKADFNAVAGAISGALRPKQGERAAQVEARRQQRCDALAEAISASLRGTQRQPTLERISTHHRMVSLEVLAGKSRSVLRYRRAALTLALGMGK